jgi:hypothetical protein
LFLLGKVSCFTGRARMPSNSQTTSDSRLSQPIESGYC